MNPVKLIYKVHDQTKVKVFAEYSKGANNSNEYTHQEYMGLLYHSEIPEDSIPSEQLLVLR